MQKEFFKHGKSTKWRKLRSIFRKAKKKASKSFYSDFVSDLKVTKPGQYFKMAKRIGGKEQQSQGEIYIECLDGMDPQEQVEAVAASFVKRRHFYRLFWKMFVNLMYQCFVKNFCFLMWAITIIHLFPHM